MNLTRKSTSTFQVWLSAKTSLRRQKATDAWRSAGLTVKGNAIVPSYVLEYLLGQYCATVGLRFSWEFDDSSTVNARHIITDHGWQILLARGLDIFQPYEMNDTFAISNRMPRYRPCKGFEVTYVRVDASLFYDSVGQDKDEVFGD